MKRQTAMALAAVFAMSVAGTALAAPANPFVDVPAKHWAYDSINQLAKAGVVSGFGDGTYKGDKTLTRYEVAVIVAKAMANSDKMDAETKKALDALKAEFGTELNNLGVRIDNVEKKLDNVKFTGEIRARYEHAKAEDNTVATGSVLRTRLYVEGKISDEWTYNARFLNEQDWKTSSNQKGNEDRTFLDNAYVTGKIFGTTTKLGRFDVVPAYGLVLDSTIDGVAVSFGEKLKADLIYGRDKNAVTVGTTDVYSVDNNGIVLPATKTTNNDNRDADILALNLGYAVNDKTNIKAAYEQIKVKNVPVTAGLLKEADKVKVFEIGADTKIGPDFKLSAAYAKSDVPTGVNKFHGNKAYWYQLDYKGADSAKPGTFGAWVNYRKIDDGASWSSTFDNVALGDVYNNQTFGGVGSKGYEIGFNYTPWKQTLFTAAYVDAKGIADSSVKNKWYRAQMEFFF